MNKQKKYIFIFFAGYCLFYTKALFAYIDPGSGSYFIQIIIATLAGIFLTITSFWKKPWFFIKNLFKKRKDKE